MAHAGHGFHSTHIELHDDGSATIHHQHSEGSHKDKKYAAADLDGVHDGLEDHLRIPEDQEEKIEEKIHPGIHQEALKKTGNEEELEDQVHPGIHKEVTEKAKEGV
jgi:hypothetical protein